jgi:hypothetical protein
MEDLMLMDTLRKKTRPVLLPGPVFVNPRRWQRYGVVRQTLRNWRLATQYRWGVPPDRLAASYPRHNHEQES